MLAINNNNLKYYLMACPVRPKAEISLLPDEVADALNWALSYDSRQQEILPPPPPFEKSIISPPSSEDNWSYIWSKRAWDIYRKIKPHEK